MKFDSFTVLGLSLASALSLLSTFTPAHALPVKSPSTTAFPSILPNTIIPKHNPKLDLDTSFLRTNPPKTINGQQVQGFDKHEPSSVKELPSSRKSSNPGTLPKSNPLPTTISTTSSPTPTELPLLLLPDSHAVWQPGSVQQVQWSKKYIKKLPKDTTIDIVLLESRTNKRIHTFKRYIPYRKSAAQVWVPSKIPEGSSYVLLLELFHGRSQTPIAMNSAMLGSNSSSLFSSSSSTSTQSSTTTTTTTATTTTTTTKITTMSTPVEGVEEESPKLNNKGSRAFPSIVRRSEINIARRRRRQDTGDRAPFSSTPSSTSDSITHVAPHNVNDDTYFQEGKGPQLMDLRFPGVIQPIEIEHTFGVYNTVYSQTPYTLKWIVPARTAELLEYTENRLRLMADKSIDWALHGSLKENHKTFLAKMLVELVMDHTLEPVSVLSRNVPAETKFLITQIHERVPNAFYRLKIQMVVVEVQEDSTAQDQLRRDQASPPFSATRPSHGDYMEGWDFPSGGKIIDRYESITRRFWVSSGAL